MGYSTEFTGSLKFTSPLSNLELKEVSKFLGEDCRKHPEWDTGSLTYIDLQLTDDLTGLEWDTSEKTYNLVEKVNFIMKEMQKKFPSFSLEGDLLARGEAFDDIWYLRIEDEVAIKVPLLGI